MIRLNISLENIGTTVGCDPEEYIGSDMVERLVNEGLEKAPPIPVIRLPESLITDGMEYFQTDGNHRFAAAALRGDKTISSVAYNQKDDVDSISRIAGLEHGALHTYCQIINLLTSTWKNCSRVRRMPTQVYRFESRVED